MCVVSLHQVWWSSIQEDVRDGVSTTSDGLLAGSAVPDTGRVTLDGNLSAEGAGVTGVLGDFHFLHLLTERSTISVFFCQSESRYRRQKLQIVVTHLVPYLPVMPTSVIDVLAICYIVEEVRSNPSKSSKPRAVQIWKFSNDSEVDSGTAMERLSVCARRTFSALRHFV